VNPREKVLSVLDALGVTPEEIARRAGLGEREVLLALAALAERAQVVAAGECFYLTSLGEDRRQYEAIFVGGDLVEVWDRRHGARSYRG
jgi:hypothetical protein